MVLAAIAAGGAERRSGGARKREEFPEFLHRRRGMHQEVSWEDMVAATGARSVSGSNAIFA
jgi:hypothetical protein